MHYFSTFFFLEIGDNDNYTANILFKNGGKKFMSLIWQTSAFMIMKIHAFFLITVLSAQRLW